MDLNNVISLYNEGQAITEKCKEACYYGSGVLGINFQLGYIHLDNDTFKSIVKNPDDVVSTTCYSPVLGRQWEHSVIVNGIKFITISEKEDLYETV